MSKEKELEEATIGGEKFVSGETEVYVSESFMGVDEGIYMRVKSIYETEDGVAMTFSYANGTGPEVDAPEEVISEALGSKLEFREYDSQMHD